MVGSTLRVYTESRYCHLNTYLERETVQVIDRYRVADSMIVPVSPPFHHGSFGGCLHPLIGKYAFSNSLL